MDYSAHNVRYRDGIVAVSSEYEQIGARTLTASQNELSRLRGVVSGRSTSVRRSSARVTGFNASLDLTIKMLGSGLVTTCTNSTPHSRV